MHSIHIALSGMNTLELARNSVPLYRDNVLVKCSATIAHVAKITEYEGSGDIKATSYDVLAILSGKPLSFLYIQSPVPE